MAQKRQYEAKVITRGYRVLDTAKVDHDLYRQMSESGSDNIIKQLVVPKKTGLAWELQEGQTCRIVLPGSQVGDMNIWNLHNTKEHFYSGKTRQIHRSHLTCYDRLWSNLPYLRPLATVTGDSLHDFGTDSEGFGVHDVLGTRCDPYTHRYMTGVFPEQSCHTNLVQAIKPWGLSEFDVHDVFNIFMCTAIDRDTKEYLIRGSPARKGDFIEIVAEMDLLVALSACPYGDVSMQCGEKVPDDACFHLDVKIGQPGDQVLSRWKMWKDKNCK